MNIVRIYIDENPDAIRLRSMKQLIKSISHEIVVDYEAQQNMPMQPTSILREQ